MAKVFPANIKAASDKTNRILAIGKTADGKILIEYSNDNEGERTNLLSFKDGCANHICAAAAKGFYRGCWHLGILGMIGAVQPMTDIQVNQIEPEPELIIEDQTPLYCGRTGQFKQSRLSKSCETTSVKKDYELPEEDRWLAKYNFSRKLLDAILEFRQHQEEILTEEQKKAIPQPKYIPSGYELEMAIAPLLFGKGRDKWVPCLLKGPKGTGKSSMAKTIAAILKLRPITIFGAEELDMEHVLGSKTLSNEKEDLSILEEAKIAAGFKAAGLSSDNYIQRLKGQSTKIVFEPGILLKAVEMGDMVILDEVNMLRQGVTSILNGLLDWQREISVPDYGTIKAHPSFRLVACMNPGYAGTQALNEAFDDRYAPIYVNYLPPDKMAEMIIQETGCTLSIADRLAELFKMLTNLASNGDISEKVVSARLLCYMAEAQKLGLMGGNLVEIAKYYICSSLDDQFEVEHILKDIIEGMWGRSVS